MRRLKVGIVVLVGVSAGLIAIQGDASLAVVLAAIAGGFLVGAALVWYLFRNEDRLTPGSDRRRR